jgi:hypothetical protein
VRQLVCFKPHVCESYNTTAIMKDLNGGRTSEVRYMPWGADRYTYSTTPTTMRYTVHAPEYAREYSGGRQEGYINLCWYISRWYDPALRRCISTDALSRAGADSR